MKTLEEFKEFCKSNIAQSVYILETERRGIARQMKLQAAFLISLLILILLILSLGGLGPPGILLLLAFMLLAPFYWYGKKNSLFKGYRDTFKKIVVSKIIEFIDNTLKYSPNLYIDEQDFIRSHIFTLAHDTYLGDDYVSGNVGLTSVEFSEVYSACNLGRGGTCVIFKGMFFLADFNKNFIGRTVILPDKAEKRLGRLGRKLQKKHRGWGERVDLENPDFEKHFVVYSDDQIMARYILSSSLMDKIVRFVDSAERKVYLSFIDSKVYIAIPYYENLFEPKLFSSLLDFRPLQKYFEDLELAIGIVEDLNLNTRIWTKQ
jgi:hypothetical protein